MKLRIFFSLHVYLYIIIFHGTSAFAAVGSRIKVDPTTAKTLSILLTGSDSLHSKIVVESAKRDNKKIKEDASQLIQLVRVAVKTAREKEPAENLIHLEKILLSTEGRLQDFLSVPDADMPKKMFFLREFFQHVIQLARQYEINHSFHIFFCPKDKQKGIWLQKASKAQNPYDVDGPLRNCGALVK